jgi:F420H(2)-dependent quinone reductase
VGEARSSRLQAQVLKAWMRFHRWAYQRTNGKVLSRMRGKPTLLLTTTGRRSGRLHTVPLPYLAEGDTIAGLLPGTPHFRRLPAEDAGYGLLAHGCRQHSLLPALAVSCRPWRGPGLDGEAVAAAACRSWQHVLSAGFAVVTHPLYPAPP